MPNRTVPEVGQESSPVCALCLDVGMLPLATRDPATGDHQEVRCPRCCPRPDLYHVHLACHDPHTGRFQGCVDAVQVHDPTAPDPPLLSLERAGEPLSCAFYDQLWTLGCVPLLLVGRLPSVSSASKAFETVVLDAATLALVLDLLCLRGWHLRHSTPEGRALWEAAGTGVATGQAGGRTLDHQPRPEGRGLPLSAQPVSVPRHLRGDVPCTT